ncbi:MAG: periplasmic heavy metal sensor [Melioribacteraceae bacterium]
MKKLGIFIITVFLLGNTTIFSQSGQREAAPRNGKGNMKALLKLTPDQEKKFEDMRYQHQQSVIDIRAGIQKTRLELKKNIEEGKIDENKVLQLTGEIHKLEGDIKYSSTKHWLEIYKMLNDDQKEIFSKHLSRMILRGPGNEKTGAGMKMKRNSERRMNREGMMNRRGMR